MTAFEEPAQGEGSAGEAIMSHAKERGSEPGSRQHGRRIQRVEQGRAELEGV